MIPSIEQIVHDLLAGKITDTQAIAWLNTHAELAAAPDEELRDYFAAKALVECIRVAEQQTPTQIREPKLSALFDKAAVYAYAVADAMLKARDE